MGATGSSGHGSCSWAYWNLNPAALADPACYSQGGATMLSAVGLAPAPEVPMPTNTGQIVTGITPTGNVDVAGNPTYDIASSTAAENMAALKAQIQAFLDAQPPADDPCSHWYSMFNSDCNDLGNYLAIGGAIVGALLLVNLTGGRR